MDTNDIEILNRADGLLLGPEEIVAAASCGSMWGQGATCENLILLPSAGAPGVEATVKFRPQNGGEQAGVVLFRDWDNYIKLVRESVRGEQVIVVAREIDGQPKPVLHEPCEAAHIHFRLAIEHDVVTARWKILETGEAGSESFENWFETREGWRPGLLVHGRNASNRAVFSSFRVG